MRMGIAALALAAGLGLAAAGSAEERGRIVLANLRWLPEAGGKWCLVDLGPGNDPTALRRAPVDLPELAEARNPEEPWARLYGERLVTFSRGADGQGPAGFELRVYRVAEGLRVERERSIRAFARPEQREASRAGGLDDCAALFFPTRIWIYAARYSGRDYVLAGWKVDAEGLVEPLPDSAYGPLEPAGQLAQGAGRKTILPLLQAYRGDETALAAGYSALSRLYGSPASPGAAEIQPKDRAILASARDGGPAVLHDFRSGEARALRTDGGEARILPLTDSEFRLDRAALLEAGGRPFLAYCQYGTLSLYDMEHPLYPRRLALARLPGSGEEYRAIAASFGDGFLVTDRRGDLLAYRVGADGSLAPAWDSQALLAAAIEAGDAARAAALCEAGADPRLAGPGGEPLWLAAAVSGEDRVLDALLARLDELEGGRGDGGLPAYWRSASPVRYAISIGEPEAALALARRKPAALAEGPDGDALFDAAALGDTALCGALIDAGASPSRAFRSGPSYGNALAWAKDEATRAYLRKRGVPDTVTLAEPQGLYGRAEGLVLRSAPSTRAAIVARGGKDFSESQFSLLSSRATLDYIEGRMGRWIKVRPGDAKVEGWAPSYAFMHAYDDGP